MRFRIFLTAAFAAAALTVTGLALAAGGGPNNYGPYAGNSPDSGTCGNDWANDTFQRVFKVQQGGTVLREEFQNGEFTTLGGFSPGRCETDSNHGTSILPGITGRFHGYLEGTVTGGVYDPTAICADPCTGSTFLLAFFGPAALWNVDTFSFEYAVGNGVAYHSWKNASDNRGGNRGDIATS